MKLGSCCEKVNYCSRECQKQHWHRTHKQECGTQSSGDGTGDEADAAAGATEEEEEGSKSERGPRRGGNKKKNKKKR